MIKSGVLLGAGAGACWGLVFLIPLVLSGFSPLEIASGRFLVYGSVSLLLLLPFLPRMARGLGIRDIGFLLALGASGNVLFYVFLASSIQKVGVAPAALVIGLVPVLVTILGRNDQGTVPLPQLVLPLAMLVVGMVCITVDTLQVAGSTANTLLDAILGLLFAAGALVSWSFYAVFNARALKANTVVSSQQWAYLTGMASGFWALVLALVIWGFQSPSTAGSTAGGETLDWQMFWLVSLGIGLVGSVLANGLWNGASRRLPMTLTAQVFAFEPLFALIYGFVFEARLPRPLEMAAVLLLISAMLWTVQKHSVAGKRERQQKQALTSPAS
ncbi:EamA family transporter [Marinobacter fuscus]|uniref:EamA family transporter n=1 Tax=Marinobacter fuscus TaxID=2109942 RepID=A0A2T1KHT0_9GAMM|nr:DMT family transporter [Marinobacter fuscus]PSF09701.1 EamA family transporter [Marinobacter fuscus]